MDLAIFSTRIFTGDPERPDAEAVGIRNGRIAAVGSNDSVRQECSRKTLSMEMPGRLITPGIVDAHLHFVNLGMTLKWVNLRNLPSLHACREAIRKVVSSYPPGSWIVGRGWNHHQWDDSREPTRADLDDLTPRNPAMMIRACGHSVWVNALALQAAGITRETPDPPGGKIDRDPKTGDPTGLLREARKLIEKHIPPPSLEERKQFARNAQLEALRHGITGVHSCETLMQWEALAGLAEEGQLKIRVHHLLPPEELEEADRRGIISEFKNDRLWFGHVKLFADGSLGAGTALLHEPYTDAPTECGIACLNCEEMVEKISKAYRYGKDAAIHAIGDLAVTNALRSIAEARKKYPGPRRDRIEHVQLFRPEDLAVFRKLDVTASVQPVFLPTDWQPAGARWGEARCRHAYAWKSIRREGIRHQFGSDAPVESINPLFGFQAAATRQCQDRRPSGGWYPEEKLTLAETLDGFVRTSAWSSYKENELGSITAGKWADLTVFGQDLFDVRPEDWHRGHVEMTIVNGEIVYRK